MDPKRSKRASTIKSKTPPCIPGRVGSGYLYMTAAGAGAVVMIIEVLGASMVAPYMGTSHFVWSAQIAVTLLSLTTGYVLSGYAADRAKGPDGLYGGLFLGALFLMVPAVFRAPIAFWALRFDLPQASFMTAVFLFFIPLTLFAAATPYLIRFLTGSMDVIGSRVGRLTAVGTVGSLAGTGIASYIMIPLLRHEVSLYLTAGAVTTLVAGYFILTGKILRALMMTALFVLVLMGANTLMSAMEGERLFTHVTELYKKNSNYGLLQVLESRSGSWRVLLSDYLVQNQYDEREGGKSISVPPYLLYNLSRRYCKNLDSALCIGLGAGVVPMMLIKDGVAVDVIEINPVMKEIAETYFGFNSKGMEITINDARFVLNKSKKHYDAVLLDAFLGDAAPFHLMTREAFLSIRERLNPGGTLVINTIGDFKSKNHLFTASITRTLKSVFPHVGIHGIAEDEGGVYFVASDHKLEPTAFCPDWHKVHKTCLETVEKLFCTVREPDLTGAILLTDSYNPMPVIDARRRESLRRHFFMQVRNL